MRTLKTFSEKEQAYHLYQRRQAYYREQLSIQRQWEMLRSNQEQERAAKEEALAEIERLKAQLGKS